MKLPIAACLLCLSCGGSVVAPDRSPFRVVLDGTPLAFDDGISATAYAVGSVVHLSIAGGSERPDGPIPGRAILLYLDIDRAATGSDTPLTIAGIAQFDGTDAPVPAYQARAGASPTIEIAYARVACDGCVHHGERQSLDGTMTLNSFTPTHVKGTYHLSLDGAIPGYSAPSAKATFDGEIDADILSFASR